MMRIFALALVWIILPAAAGAGAEADSLRFGPFGTVRLYYETPRPANVVIFISGDGGWNLGVVDMARALESLDAAVVGVDITHFIRALERSSEKCLYPAGDLELLSKAVQRHLQYDDYRAPVLVGYSSGATLVYAALAQSPGETFKGAISLGFCPDLPLSRPMCHGDGLDWEPGPRGKGYSFLPTSKLEVPWVALQGDVDKVCSPEDTRRFVSKVSRGEIIMLPKVGHGFSVQRNWMPQFKAAFMRIAAAGGAGPAPSRTPGEGPASAVSGDTGKVAARAPAETTQALAAPPELRGLPIVEVPSAKRASNALVIILSGDGGWGKTEQGISSDLAAKGVSVVGVNSLHYFWKKRTPDGAAADLERIARHYLTAWRKDRLVLVGYSFGADVLPFLVTRFPGKLRGAVEGIVLISPSRDAEFQFHIGDWFGRTSSSIPYRTKPEIEKLRGTKIFCFYGEDDTDVLCTELDATLATTVALPGGHRVRGRYAPISKAVLETIAQTHELSPAAGGDTTKPR